MRPLYENLSTVVDEVEFFRSLSRHEDYNCYKFRKLPLGYEIECSMENRGSIHGWCEFKRRHVNRRDYPTLILSLHKYRKLVSYSGRQESLLFVRWNDEDAVHHIYSGEIEYEIKIGGRKDRGDWQDIEPVVHIPVEAFVPLDLDREDLSHSDRERLGRLFRSGRPWVVGEGNGR